jgi:hypothetical protein
LIEDLKIRPSALVSLSTANELVWRFCYVSFEQSLGSQIEVGLSAHLVFHQLAMPGLLRTMK